MYVAQPPVWQSPYDNIPDMDNQMALACLSLIRADREPLRVVVDHYREMIKADTVKYRTIGQKLPPEQDLLHLLWMLDSIDNAIEQSITQKHRWVGFVQCALVNLGFTAAAPSQDWSREVLNGL